MQTDLVALLRGLCPRVFAGVAPLDTPRPYLTWQVIGGRSLYYLSNAPADKRHALVLVATWADTRAEAIALSQAVEDAVAASNVFTATPDGAAIDVMETEVEPWRYGAHQDFNVYSDR